MFVRALYTSLLPPKEKPFLPRYTKPLLIAPPSPLSSGKNKHSLSSVSPPICPPNAVIYPLRFKSVPSHVNEPPPKLNLPSSRLIIEPLSLLMLPFNPLYRVSVIYPVVIHLPLIVVVPLYKFPNLALLAVRALTSIVSNITSVTLVPNISVFNNLDNMVLLIFKSSLPKFPLPLPEPLELDEEDDELPLDPKR